MPPHQPFVDEMRIDVSWSVAAMVDRIYEDVIGGG